MKLFLVISNQNDPPKNIEAVISANITNSKVITTFSRKQGIKLAKEEQPDTILLDIILPEIDGYEFCKHLKEDISTKHIPIILISAVKTDSKTRVNGLNCGASAILSIPIDADELVTQINILLRIKEDEEKLRNENRRLEKLVNEKTVKQTESREKYKALYENAPLPYQSLNEDGSFKDINPAWLDKLGYKRDEVIGNFYKDFLHPEWQEHFEKNFPAFKKRGYVSDVEFKIRHKNGHYIDISFEGCIGTHPDGSFKQTYCVFQDITERKMISDNLLKSTNDLLKSQEIAILGHWSYDHINNNVFGSPELYKIFGLSNKILQLEDFVSILHPDDREYMSSNINNALKSFKPYDIEYRIIVKGELKWIRAIGEVELNNEGELKQFSGIVQDITKRKQIEISLAENEHKFKLLAENTNDWEYWLDENNEYVYISSACESMTGCKIEEFYNTSDLLFDMIHPDDKSRVYKHYHDDDKSRRGPKFSNEFRIVCQDGATKWIEHTCTPVYDENKKFKGRRGNNRDITQRKRSEKELLKKQFYLIKSQEIAIAGIWELDFLTSNLTWTEENYKICGVPLGTNVTYEVFLNCVHPDDREYVDSQWKAAMEIKSYDIEHRLLVDGKVKWVREKAELQFDENGNAYAAIGVTQDITSRKEVEKTLIESEEKYKLVAENASDVVWIIDFETSKLIYVSPSIKLQRGFTQEEVMNQTLIDYLTPVSFEYLSSKVPERIKRFKKGVRENFVDELEQICKNGSTIWTEVKAKYVENNKTGKIEIVGVTRNITEQRKSENKIKDALTKAEESDRLKSAFLANMSHEIRTPMNGILGFARLLKEPDLTGDEKQQYISIIEKGGDRMLNIINDIISISMIESGQIKVDIQESNINEQIEYIYNFFKFEVQEKGMQLSFSNTLPSSKAIIKTDREKVFAILTNLVKNAIKYSETGSIKLGYNVINDFLEFYVKDTGIGIPRDRQEAIFERFIQADIEDKMARQGAGLGLSISKAYVEKLGGKIWLESEEASQAKGEGGSTFYFTLPYRLDTRKENNAENNTLIPVNHTANKKLKILIVEDDETSKELISIYAQKFAEEIIVAKTGLEAIEAHSKYSDIDLILMDIQLPKMNGYEATRHIRKSDNDVIIIAQTAYGLKGDREKAIDAGCNDYISKPINQELLIEKLNKYFN